MNKKEFIEFQFLKKEKEIRLMLEVGSSYADILGALVEAKDEIVKIISSQFPAPEEKEDKPVEAE